VSQLPEPAGPGRQAPSELYRTLRPDDVVSMLDRLTDGIFVFDAGWRFTYVNDPAARMLGHPRETLLGSHAWTLFPEGPETAAYRAYEQARDECRQVRVTQFYEPLGKHFDIRAYPVGDSLIVIFRDITDAQRTEDELREYADQMSEAERIARFGVWKWNIPAGTVRWSAELHRIFGVEPVDMAGTLDDYLSRVHPGDRDRVWNVLREAADAHGAFQHEHRILRPDGTERLVVVQGGVSVNADGAPVAVGVCHDVTERRATERALSRSDRRMRTIVDKLPSAVVVKDLEGRYLMANAEAGRILGLDPQELVGRRTEELFPHDIAQRLRNDDAIALAEGRPVFDEGILPVRDEPRTYTIVTFPLPDEDGRPVEICTIGTDVTERRQRETERRKRVEWRERISSALVDGRMVVHAQPVVELATGEETSSELLIRMHADGPGDELLPPGAFLPIAERFELIQMIDAWVVRRALELDDGSRKREVNLSAVTLCDPQARREIVGMLAASPEQARSLIFEITETAAADHLAAASLFAEDVTRFGCGLALDDFGTGFGSFTYLRSLPLRYLKIDLSFVSRMVDSVDDRRVVQSIIGIAEQFGLRTIAEGVEDQATMDLLRDMGADFAQGYHVGRPVPTPSSPAVR
jgi:PAS domain S-box-containing protein